MVVEAHHLEKRASRQTAQQAIPQGSSFGQVAKADPISNPEAERPRRKAFMHVQRSHGTRIRNKATDQVSKAALQNIQLRSLMKC